MGCCSCSSKGGFKGGRSRAGQESLVGLMLTVSQLSYSQTSHRRLSLVVGLFSAVQLSFLFGAVLGPRG